MVNILDPQVSTAELARIKQIIPQQSIIDHNAWLYKDSWKLEVFDRWTLDDGLFDFLLEVSDEAEFVYELRLTWGKNCYTSWCVMSNGIVVRLLCEADLFVEKKEYYEVFDLAIRSEDYDDAIVSFDDVACLVVQDNADMQLIETGEDEVADPLKEVEELDSLMTEEQRLYVAMREGTK